MGIDNIITDALFFEYEEMRKSFLRLFRNMGMYEGEADFFAEELAWNFVYTNG